MFPDPVCCDMCAGQYPLSLDRGDTVDYASMWKRKPLPYVPVRDGASSEAIKAATIDVERTKGPILPISVNDGRLSPPRIWQRR